MIRQVDPPGGDTAAPTITATDGGQLPVGQTALVTYSCADAGVGVESCTGSVPSGTAIDTSEPGTTTVTIRAWDRNGNVASRTLTWTVVDGSTTTTAPTAPTTDAPPTTAPATTPTTASGTLPRTGSSPNSSVATGILLVLAGLVLTGLSRRWRQAT